MVRGDFPSQFSFNLEYRQCVNCWSVFAGCTEGDCPVTIEHNSLGADEHYDSYNAWAVGDDLLDWTSGAEEGQVKKHALHTMFFAAESD